MKRLARISIKGKNEYENEKTLVVFSKNHKFNYYLNQ